MSQRSRREHKPTSKFLSYKTQELSPKDQTENLKNKKPSFPTKYIDTPVPAKRLVLPAKHKDTPVPSRNFVSSTTTKNNVTPSIAKGAAIHGRRKLTTDQVEVLCVSTADSSPEVSEKSPEIRRTNRQHKPNSKLKEYIDLSRKSESASSLSLSKTANPQNVSKKATYMFEVKNPSKKSFKIAVDSDENGCEISPGYSKRLSVGLVDCFEGLAKDLAVNYPRSEEKLDNSVKKTDDNEIGRRGIKRSLTKDMEDSYKSPSQDKKESNNEPLPKRERLTPTAVRNLTKTKKSTKVTTVVETVNLSNNQRQKTITQNKKLKVTKQYPLKSPVNVASSFKENNSSRISSPRLLSGPKPSSPQISETTSKTTSRSPIMQNDSKDISEILKKFLIMGTKVANAISVTLKQNEEILLAKSSTFEKKCLSLVHALAKQGTDLEEDDMEKVLKLLDEEQEERRGYRRTLLESLRASHLTNMALYNQTLGLLKTL